MNYLSCFDARGKLARQGIRGARAYKRLAALLPVMLLAATASAGAAQQAKAQYPNILLFLVDDMGWSDTSLVLDRNKGVAAPGVLNRFYHTPNMQRLAACGSSFNQAYAAPVCSPSRSSIISGQMPARHGVTTWTALQSPKLNDEVPVAGICGAQWKMAGLDGTQMTLPRQLAGLGYRCISVGKAHFAPNDQPCSDPCKLGFALNIAGSGLGGPGSYLAEQNFVKANALHQVPGLDKYHLQGKNPSLQQRQQHFLTSALTTEMLEQIRLSVANKQPFFAYMSHYAVHSTHADADPNFAVAPFAEKLSGLPKDWQVRSKELCNYASLLAGMDQSLGRLIDGLQKLGVAENTLIIFVSDNGGDAPINQTYGGNMQLSGRIGAVSPLRGRKGSAYEGGSRVPLIIAWAKPDEGNALQRGFPVRQGVVNTQLAAVWDIYPTLLDLLGNKAEGQVDGISLKAQLAGAQEQPREILQHFPHSHSYGRFYSSLRQGDWKVIYRYDIALQATGAKAWELYNLAEDPSESHNLASLPQQRQRLQQLAVTLKQRLEKIGARYPRQCQRDAQGGISSFGKELSIMLPE